MGTAGARFMVAKQLAASGGLFLEEGATRLCLDPGPGAVVQYAKRKVDPARLDGIILSHRHLDHSGDVNVMIEAMTEGGFRHRGRVFCPPDALDEDPVVLRYLRGFPEDVSRLEASTRYTVGDVIFETSPLHVHGSQTFGFRFTSRDQPERWRLGWVTDSALYDGIAAQHRAEVMIVHLVLMEGRNGLPHLSLADVERIIGEARPARVLITHFGMTVWRARPWEVAAGLSERTGVDVRAARDGMSIEV